MANHKKYSVSYSCCSTGYGWRTDYDRIDEFDNFIKNARHERSYEVWVYDFDFDDFIFIKRGGTYEIEKDMLGSFRDLRTTTRMHKPANALC